MPIDKYFKGRGKEVMESMKTKYGEKKGESVFYATANKKGMKPGKGGKSGKRGRHSFKGGARAQADALK